MRSLQRASLVLSTLAAAPGQHLDAIAAHCALPRSSCARLLAALAALGWVEHHGARGGWRLGARAQALAEGRPYCTALVAAATGPLRAAAHTLQQPVALSVLAGNRRMVLMRVQPDGTCDRRLIVDPDVGLAGSTAGRLLIAMQTPALRRRLCAACGLPDPVCWPGVVDAHELATELRALARERALEHTHRGMRSAATVLPDGDGGWAALGTFRRGSGHPRALAVLAQAAKRITARL